MLTLLVTTGLMPQKLALLALLLQGKCTPSAWRDTAARLVSTITAEHMDACYWVDATVACSSDTTDTSAWSDTAAA